MKEDWQAVKAAEDGTDQCWTEVNSLEAVDAFGRPLVGSTDRKLSGPVKTGS